MKKLILLALCMGLLTSCVDEYTAKDRDGAPILIRDVDGVVADAKALGLDSIYVRNFDMDQFYEPLRRMGDDETTVSSDTINGKRYTWFATYRVIHMENVKKR